MLHSGLYLSLICLPPVTYSSPIFNPLCKSLLLSHRIIICQHNRNCRTEFCKLELSHSSTMYIFAHELCSLVQASQWDLLARLFKVLLWIFLHFRGLKRNPQRWVCCPLLLRLLLVVSLCWRRTSLTRAGNLFARPGLVEIRSRQDQWVRICKAQVYLQHSTGKGQGLELKYSSWAEGQRQITDSSSPSSWSKVV